MDTKHEPDLKILAIIAALILVLAIAFVYTQQNYQSNKKNLSFTIAGKFNLTDHNGTEKTHTDFGDKYKLIYFGFTYCPAICPTELAKMTAALERLTPEKSAQIQPLFITIDPERDTPEALKSYVSLFHPNLIGLTGTVDQINTVKKTYRIYAKKVQDETLNDYTMDHSSYIYFMTPKDELISIYRTMDTANTILNDINKQLENN